VATYRAESWTLNKNIAKLLAVFERKVLRRMCGRIKVNEKLKKCCSKEFIQLFEI
jgi:hypothetical protein